MKAPLPNLLAQLRNATAEPGKKAELAKSRRAPLASVSRWLARERERGGETVLHRQVAEAPDEVENKTPCVR